MLRIPLKSYFTRRTVLLLAVTALFSVMIGRADAADERSIYGPGIGAGDAWTLGTANTGVAIDSGLVGGSRNPAAYLTARNEIHGEGDAWGAFTLKNRVSPNSMVYGAGMIGYLTSARSGNGSFVLTYLPRSRFEAGATYNTGKLADRVNLNEYGVAYAFRMAGSYAAGIYVGALHGEIHNGSLVESSDQDTLYTPRLWLARLGLQRRAGAIRWGVVLESPAIGAIWVERPVLHKRDRTIHSYRGAWGARAGFGWTAGTVGVEADVAVHDAGFIRLGDTPLSGRGLMPSFGITAHGAVDPKIQLNGGLRYAVGTNSDPRSLILGVGGTFDLTPDVTLFGGGELLFPNGNHLAGTALEDVRPYDLRAGIMFHGK